jgi:hypothetical protein
MIDVQPPFEQHFFELAITQRITQVSPCAQQDDLGFEVTPIKEA